jgi:hypothetical protein
MSTTGGYVEKSLSVERQRNSITRSMSESANYGGAVETTNDRPKRIRNRKASLQLQAALNDAEILSQAEPTPDNISRMKLAQVRLTVLSRKASRELIGDLKRLKDILAKTKAENERLTRQHEQDAIELARLRAICRAETGVTFDDIARTAPSAARRETNAGS